MTQNLLPVLGYILAIIVLSVSFVFWRRSLKLQEDLRRITSDRSAGKKIEIALSDKVAELRASQEHHDRELAKLRKDVKSSQNKLTASEQLLAAKEAETTSKLQQSKNETDHFRSEAQVLLAQIGEIDREKSILRQQLADVKKTRDERHADKLKRLSEQIHTLKAEARESARERTRMVDRLEKAPAIDPKEMDDLKRRLAQYRFFVKSTKLQKEMIEERSANWEHALRQLSTWILAEHGEAKASDNIGSLVADALEITHRGPMIDDQFSKPANEQRAGASSQAEESYS